MHAYKQTFRVTVNSGSLIILYVLGFILLSSIIATSSWENLTPEEALNKLPGRSLSVEFVLLTALESADVFDQLRAELKKAPVLSLRSRSSLDPVFFGGALYEDNKGEPATAFAPSQRKTFGGRMGVRGSLPTGTQLQASAQHEKSRLNFLNSPETDYHLNRIEFSANQSLTKDFFGQGNRALMRSGSAGSQAIAQSIKVQGENLLLQFVSLYLEAWLGQNRVITARDSLERRRRLKRSVDARLRRGNAVKSEGLQVNSAVLSSEVELLKAERSLQETWRALVIGLKLPLSFLSVDPTTIPVKLDGSIQEAEKLCRQLKEADILERNNEVSASRYQAEAQTAKNEYARGQSRWDVQATGKIGAQNREDHFSNALADSAGLKNPDWSVGVELSIPFLSLRERADRQEALSNSLQAKASESLTRSSVQIRWANACQGLTTAKKEIDSFKESAANQKSREAFESERYRLGSTTAFNVVSAGDDLSFADSNWRGAEAEGRLTAWNVLVLSGEVLKKFEDQLK